MNNPVPHLRLSALLLTLIALPALAGGHDEARELREAGEILPLQQILSHLDPAAGRVLEVELKHRDDRYIYEVEILNDRGEVWEHRYDARSGELLKIEPED
jgi:uncharacterized membrane protein YkoI